MSIDAAVEGALKRDRIVILAALSTVIVISWTYVLAGQGDPNDLQQAGMQMIVLAAWDMNYAVLMFFMWWAMMVAMMQPSAAPTVLPFAAMSPSERKRAMPGSRHRSLPRPT
jgi:predicted metal-binding membrane protein